MAKRRAELKAHNKRMMEMSPAERTAYRKRMAGKKMDSRTMLLKNKGGFVAGGFTVDNLKGKKK